MTEPVATLNQPLAGAMVRMHCSPETLPACVDWYVAYLLSQRQLEKMMAERAA
ncbi:hypothetical protein [Burkholderia cepacia]|uniref:hypothetical protein n=1 Tax=Burkholderia cepacia TaxID=292 RepID=UPI002AB6E754|nr:hypothetical protein [Burkholderia cepacia]